MKRQLFLFWDTTKREICGKFKWLYSTVTLWHISSSVHAGNSQCSSSLSSVSTSSSTTVDAEELLVGVCIPLFECRIQANMLSSAPSPGEAGSWSSLVSRTTNDFCLCRIFHWRHCCNDANQSELVSDPQTVGNGNLDMVTLTWSPSTKYGT